jgi:hypothetical protein
MKMESNTNERLNHTPGPWEVLRYPGELLVGAESTGAYVAKCDGISATIGSGEEMLANARLIASAPALYAACKAAWNDPSTSREVAVIIEAAMAQAEGKA